jgi:ATP synthase subunit 6
MSDDLIKFCKIFSPLEQFIALPLQDNFNVYIPAYLSWIPGITNLDSTLFLLFLLIIVLHKFNFIDSLNWNQFDTSTYIYNDYDFKDLNPPAWYTLIETVDARENSFINVSNNTSYLFNYNWKHYATINLIINPLSNLERFFFVLLNFVKVITKENLLVSTHIYIPVFYFIFIFIFSSNVLGLLPFSITTTGSFILIFNIALGLFIGINILGMLIQKIKYFNLFLPSGVPLILAPALVMIELVSYLARVLSLSIRLFANMVAGHSLLKIIVTSIWHVIFFSNIAFLPIALISWFILVPIFLLECVIAFLQAYVFTLLIILYLNDVINLH